MEGLSGCNATLLNNSADKGLLNEHSSFQHLKPEELRVLVPTILGLICILGVACNITAMVILFSNAHKGKLSLINSLLFNLMFADGLVLVFAMPFKAAFYSKGSWDLGWVVCKTADWFLQSCMAAKSFTVAVLANACYRYVSNPTKQVSIHIGSILVVLFFIWVSACSVTMPHWLFATLQRGIHELVCELMVPPEARYFMAVYVKAYPLLVYCAPLSFALMFFWKAYGQCQRRSSKTQNLRTQIRSRKLTLMLFSLTVAMAILWLPQWVVWVWERHITEKEIEGAQPFLSSPPLLLILSAQLLTFSISLVNPLIVLSLSEEFREGYRGLWRRLTLRKQLPPKPYPGPHNPTSLQSPCPRPETSVQLRGESFSTGSGRNAPSQPEQSGGRGGRGETDVDRVSLKDGIVLSDVEQFWHGRETGTNAGENDPVPWEHESKEGKK
ncbi:putative G-protein coupled receptor 151 [Solea senegalensis]|uniref:GPCR-2037 n=1 Tax=Solea senegalensis TaxID=28829 RepID=A0AAV6SM37_SOLSE|nr:G-protein coupled receptor 151 [Solea senegalensis]KAG7517933.1 putative G-protein coupled receptor 151 [Solea senegalensis]